VGNIGYAKHLEGARTNKATEPRLSENMNTAPEHSTLSFSVPLELLSTYVTRRHVASLE
jgi:hypothetical protein